MQIPTSPPLVGHNPRRNIALSLNWDPPIETGFPLRSELTNLQIGRVHFRREDLCPFLSSDYIQTSIWVPGLCRACRIPRNVKKKNISWDEFEMQCKLDLLWTATLWICSSQREVQEQILLTWVVLNFYLARWELGTGRQQKLILFGLCLDLNSSTSFCWPFAPIDLVFRSLSQ